MHTSLAFIAFTPCARACPECDPAIAARARFLAEQPIERAAIALVPFALTTAVAFGLERALTSRRSA
jgi:hypothetical protein